MNQNDFQTNSTPTDVLAESLLELDLLSTTPVLDQEPVVAEPAPAAPKAKRGRVAGSNGVSARREALAKQILHVFLADPAPCGCSEMVRKLEARGVTSPTVWVDTFDVLNNSGLFEAAAVLGKRAKFVLKTAFAKELSEAQVAVA